MKKTNALILIVATLPALLWVTSCTSSDPVTFAITIPNGYRGPIVVFPIAGSADGIVEQVEISVRINDQGVGRSPSAAISPKWYVLSVSHQSGDDICVHEDADSACPPGDVQYFDDGVGKVNSGPKFYSGFVGTAEEYGRFDHTAFSRRVAELQEAQEH